MFKHFLETKTLLPILEKTILCLRISETTSWQICPIGPTPPPPILLHFCANLEDQLFEKWGGPDPPHCPPWVRHWHRLPLSPKWVASKKRLLLCYNSAVGMFWNLQCFQRGFQLFRISGFCFFSRIQAKFSKISRTIVISKLLDTTWNAFQENHSLWMSTIWHQAKLFRSSGLWFRNVMTSHPKMS